MAYDKSVTERFWAKVEKTETCWLWTGARFKTAWDYGQIGINGKLLLTHHFLVGKPPEGYVWDHLCRTPRCVRPEHLELVTNQENVRRGLYGILRTECAKGHPYTEENIGYRANGIHRYCKECNRIRSRSHRRTEEEKARRRVGYVR